MHESTTARRRPSTNPHRAGHQPPEVATDLDAAAQPSRLASGADAVVPWYDPETLAVVRPEVRHLLEQSEGFQQLPPAQQREMAQTMVKVSAYMANPDGLAKRELGPDGGLLADTHAARAQARRESDSSVGKPEDRNPETSSRALSDSGNRDRTTGDTKAGGTKAGEAATATPTARALRSGAGKAGRRASSDHGFAGQDFEGGAIRQGTEEFGNLVEKVDFPAFVSDLIQSVYQAIVDASIQQMEAYGELLKNVAMTASEFAQENITLNNARDYLVDKYPEELGIDMESPPGFGFSDDFGDGFGDEDGGEAEPRLVVTGENPEEILAKIAEDLGMNEPVSDISDAEMERKLAEAAQLEIARSRQQLLATMVMMGLNRIVVTDGHIKAKVVFGMRASDVASRTSTASLQDKKDLKNRTKAKAKFGGWYSPYSGSVETDNQYRHTTTVQSALAEESESKAELKAQLSGDVRVNFKSDFLPMEKMATPQMMAAIQGRSVPREPGDAEGEEKSNA